MKKQIASLLFFCFFLMTSAQEVNTELQQHKKWIKIEQTRTFQDNLKKKYSGKDFKYKEEQIKKATAHNSLGILDFFIAFMSKIFPFLLGGIVVFLLLKVIFGLDVKFWKKQPSNTKLSKKLIYEDEDIREVDLSLLLKRALEAQNYRLAIRYYYLQALKDLSRNKLIEYHKDKTNTEYVFELNNKDLKRNFSDLTYIYTYVWYGEFSLDKMNFAKAQKKYQSFLNQLV